MTLVGLGLMHSPVFAADATTAAERDRSLYELGVLGGGGLVPDYPAADQSHFKWIAAPYFVYRGRVVRADREGARAQLLRNHLFDIEMSFAGSFSTQSRDNRARQDMPDLDYLLEAGPRVTVPISRLRGHGMLQLFLPLRAVFSTSGHDFHHRGFTATPALYLRVNDVGLPGWTVIAQVTSNFGNRMIASYFYDVAPRFAQTDRPFYDARAGYFGTDFVGGLLIPLARHVRLFSGVQLLDHDGSANTASPLFRRRKNVAAFFGVAVTFLESKRSAYPPE